MSGLAWACAAAFCLLVVTGVLRGLETVPGTLSELHRFLGWLQTSLVFFGAGLSFSLLAERTTLFVGVDDESFPSATTDNQGHYKVADLPGGGGDA